MPAEGREFGVHGFGGQHLAGRAVRLLIVEIHKIDEIAEPVMGRAHGGLPSGTFAQLAIRHQVDDEPVGILALEAKSHAHRNAKPMAERSAGDFHARRIGGHAGHGQARPIAAVGLQLVFRNDARLDERCVKRNRIMADGKQKPVAAFPMRIVRPVTHGVKPGHRQNIGNAERLAYITLALHLTHQKGVAPDPPGAFRQRYIRQRRFLRCICVRIRLSHGFLLPVRKIEADFPASKGLCQ